MPHKISKIKFSLAQIKLFSQAQEILNTQSLEDQTGFLPLTSEQYDGRPIIVTDFEMAKVIMFWDEFGNNELFAPTAIGIWRDVHYNFTWAENEGCGPTHFKSLYLTII